MAVEDDSYTKQVAVEAKGGRGAYTDGGTPTTPSLAQVLEFMKERAAEVTAALARAGITASPPSGSAALPSVTDADTMVKDLAGNANALLAAGDAEHARAKRSEGDQVNQTAAEYWEEGHELLEQLEEMASQLSSATASTDVGRGHIKTGGISQAVFNDNPNVGKDRDRADEFSLDSRW